MIAFYFLVLLIGLPGYDGSNAYIVRQTTAAGCREERAQAIERFGAGRVTECVGVLEPAVEKS